MPTLTEQLYAWPDSVAALQQTIQALDAYFLNGFVGIQGDALESLPRLFAGSPLQARLTESVESITQNAFMESHFVTLAAARSALRTITNQMDPMTRWGILERYAAAVTAVQVEQDRQHYAALNERIVAEIRANRDRPVAS